MSEQTNPIISFKNFSFQYRAQKKPTLHDINLDIYPGERVLIAGPSGSGKSTLAKLLNGLFIPSSGDVLIDGLSTSDEKNTFEIRKKAGMVFQNPDNQMVATIIEDDVAFGPENIGVPRDEIIERVDEALEAVGMNEYRKRSASKLSGGQKQRIAIAGVLAMRPDILILDDSSSALDFATDAKLRKALSHLRLEKGLTTVVVSQRATSIKYCDVIVVLDEGKIVGIGTHDELIKSCDVYKEICLSQNNGEENK